MPECRFCGGASSAIVWVPATDTRVKGIFACANCATEGSLDEVEPPLPRPWVIQQFSDMPPAELEWRVQFHELGSAEMQRLRDRIEELNDQRTAVAEAEAILRRAAQSGGESG